MQLLVDFLLDDQAVEELKCTILMKKAEYKRKNKCVIYFKFSMIIFDKVFNLL